MITYPRTDFSEVAHRIQAGDENAYAEFFRELYQPVLKRALVLLRNYADAEDATQAVFIKLWRNRSKYNPDVGDFLGWFLTLAERTLIDEYRKQQRLLRAEATTFETPIGETDETLTLSDVLADDKLDPLDAMIIQEGIETIEDILLELSTVNRLAFILHDLEGYKMGEVAKIMACSLGTAKIRAYRARHKIIEILMG